MPKERTINPAQAAHKAEKAKALKKSKSEQLNRRNEKLARRNPERLQRQIDDLKALEAGGKLRPKDKQTLEALEKDLKAVKRARDHLGDKAPAFTQRREGGGGGQQHLGKRRRDGDEDDGSETDEDVRRIPMPRDTPPPIPRRQQQQQQKLPEKPVAPAQTVYSSAPVIRNLAEESKRFVPAVVKQNLARTKGTGGRLLEPEELDKLEKAGYRDAAGAAEEGVREAEFRMMSSKVENGVTPRDEDMEIERELRRVEMEEVPDEDL